MPWVEIRYKEGCEERSKRLEGKTAGYETTEDFYFVKIWADRQTFAVLNQTVLTIELNQEEE